MFWSSKLEGRLALLLAVQALRPGYRHRRSYKEGERHAVELLIATVPDSLLPWSPGFVPRLQKRICSSLAICV